MNQEPNILEQVDQYLESKMSLGESAEFEFKLNADKELSALMTRQKVSNEIVIGCRLNNLKVMMDHDFDSGKVKNTKGNLKWWFTGLGIIIGIVVVGINYFNPNETLILNKDNNERYAEIANSAETFSGNKKYSNKQVRPELEKSKKAPKVNEISNILLPEVLKSETVDEKIPVFIANEKQELNNSDLNTKKIEPVVISKKNEVEEKKPLPDKNVEILQNESVVKKNNSYSFNPGFGEVFEIPSATGHEGEIKIMNRAGSSVFTQKIYGEHINTWDGRNFQGGISSTGLYIYIIEYTNGEKESGQIIIY